MILVTKLNDRKSKKSSNENRSDLFKLFSIIDGLRKFNIIAINYPYGSKNTGTGWYRE